MESAPQRRADLLHTCLATWAYRKSGDAATRMPERRIRGRWATSYRSRPPLMRRRLADLAFEARHGRGIDDDAALARGIRGLRGHGVRARRITLKVPMGLISTARRRNWPASAGRSCHHALARRHAASIDGAMQATKGGLGEVHRGLHLRLVANVGFDEARLRPAPRPSFRPRLC